MRAILVSLALLLSNPAAAECVHPARVLISAERAVEDGDIETARKAIPMLDESFRCSETVSPPMLTRYWQVAGIIAVDDGELQAADEYFAAAHRVGGDQWRDDFPAKARRYYDQAQARTRSAGVLRLAPEHIQYDGRINGINAIFPLKVPAGLHFIQIEMKDGSQQRFADFVFAEPGETTRVKTGMEEDLDQWVPVWLGGNFDPENLPLVSTGAALPPPPPPPVDAPPPPPPPEGSDPALPPPDGVTDEGTDDPPPPGPDPDDPLGGDLPPIDLSAAAKLDDVTNKQYRFLKPKLARQDPNPRQQVDFTAYTLEWGEVKLGMGSIVAGILPRTQVGTQPLLWAVGVPNGFAKVNPLRLKFIDVSANGRYYSLPTDSFNAQYIGAGGQTSLILGKAFGLHAGMDWQRITADGIPDLSSLSPLLSRVTGEELDGWEIPEELLPEDPRFEAQTTTIRLAADIRFNRRDSIVLQGSWINYAKVQQYYVDEEYIPPIAGLEEALKHDGAVPISSTYVASLAYNISFRQIDIRFGLGVSKLPAAWLTQAFEFSYRFGGKSRWEQARIKRQWRRDRSGRNTDATE